MSDAAEGPAVIWCPFGDESEARDVATALLDEGLVGCANILGPMVSLFQWDGARHEAREVGVLFKTDAALLDRAIERLADLHPYDSPAVIGIRSQGSTRATRAWLGALAGKERQA